MMGPMFDFTVATYLDGIALLDKVQNNKRGTYMDTHWTPNSQKQI
eukprot:gene11574-7970_t